MLYNLKNHPTRYKSILFRSRLEARWAAFFDLMGWQWEYEPIDLEGWTPDFLLKLPCSHSECDYTFCENCRGLLNWCGQPWSKQYGGCKCGSPKVPAHHPPFTHDLLVEVKPYTDISQFSDHIVHKMDEGNWRNPAPAMFGISPEVTHWCMAHGAGGGADDIRFWAEKVTRDWPSRWAEAGNITRYQPPKEIR